MAWGGVGPVLAPARAIVNPPRRRSSWLRLPLLLSGFLLFCCGEASDEDGASPGGPGGATTCTPCEQTDECGPGAACVQYAGSNYCGRHCTSQSQCAAGETCLASVAHDGTKVSVCVPSNGSCGEHGCGTCPAGTSCDIVAGDCVEPEPDGGEDAGADDDAGLEEDAGADPDGGEPNDAGSDGGTGTVKPYVGPDGGKVSKLFFAVIGDTRPPASNDTAHYPSGIIGSIYSQIQAMSPRPQFVVTTGDYMFASPDGWQGKKQMDLYLEARGKYKGTVFATLGNHECATNCAGVTTNHNYNAFLDGLVKPLGKTKPYYSVPISDIDGKWTAKIVNVACNAWSAAQKSWLGTTLAKPTTYTFIVRHHPMGSSAPCVADMKPMLSSAKYNLLMVGHVHKYSHSGKQLLEGVGGAPLTGTFNHGYATVTQLAGGGFRVRQYDYKTKQVVSTFTVP